MSIGSTLVQRMIAALGSPSREEHGRDRCFLFEFQTAEYSVTVWSKYVGPDLWCFGVHTAFEGSEPARVMEIVR